jgi:hypothetical protein
MKMERITTKQIAHQMMIFALATKRPLKGWTRTKDGKNVSTPGALVLDQCYGGFRIAEICNESGGEKDILCSYRMTARECYYVLKAANEAVQMVLGNDRFAKRVAKAFK